MKILILSGKYGMGHFMAAKALEEKFKNDKDIKKVKVLDFVDYTFPIISKSLYWSFKILTTKIPKLFAATYPFVANSKSTPLSSYFFLNKMKKLFDIEKPDIVISTLPEISKTFALYKKKYTTNIKFVTCVTDISYYYEWVADGVDLHLVPVQEIKDFLVANKIDENKIIISGIPVKDSFYNFQKATTSKFQLLIMGGGLGNIPIEEEFYKQISQHDEIETSVLCAKNKELYAKLKNEYPKIKAVSFSDSVEKYIQKADLIITKTGGITTFEAIFAKKPLITYVPFLPQEANNAKYLEKMGAAKIMWDNPKNPYNLLIQTIKNNEIQTMSKNMHAIQKDFDLNYTNKIKELVDVE